MRLFESIIEYQRLNASIKERLTYDALFSARFNAVFAPILELPQMITSAPNVNISGTTATVSWEFPGGSVSDYIVEYVLSSEYLGFTSPSVINTPQPSVCIDNLQPHSSYLLRVAVQNSEGRSRFSPVASFLTQKVVSVNTKSMSVHNVWCGVM